MASRLSLKSQEAMMAVVARTRRLAASTDEERGASMSEYGLLIALVFVVAIASVGLYGEAVVALFRETNEEYLRHAIDGTSPSSP